MKGWVFKRVTVLVGINISAGLCGSCKRESSYRRLDCNICGERNSQMTMVAMPGGGILYLFNSSCWAHEMVVADWNQRSRSK